MKSFKSDKQTRPVALSPYVGSVFLVCLTIWLYLPILKHMISKIRSLPDFDYAYLGPFVMGYLLWEKRHDIMEVSKFSDWKGLLIFCIGIFAYWLGELGGEYYIQYLSFVILLASIVFSLWGVELFKRLSFIFLISIFFLPFPDFIVRVTTSRLQLLSSSLGVLFLRLMGKSVCQDGNIIDLGVRKLQVVEACSGLRYILPLLVLSLLIGYFNKLTFWKRIILFIAAIPIAVLCNALRIALIGLLGEYLDINTVEGWFHDFEGFYIFIVALLILFFMAILLKRFFRDHLVPDDRETGIKKAHGHVPLPHVHGQLFCILVMFFGLAASGVVNAIVDFREAVPVTRGLDSFPMRLGEWKGSKDVMPQELVQELDLTSYILADFYNPEGKSVNFYVAYYQSQRKGESIHSPATCLRGSGWIFSRTGATSIEIPGAHNFKVHSALLQKAGKRQEVFYWFQQSGRIIDNIFLLKWYVFWDALTKHRTDGALVRVITPLYEGEDVDDAKQRLKSFLRLAVPELNKFLPSR